MHMKKTYIIAEIGVNHNGKYHLAKRLISKAKRCGADAVKFQTFIPSEVVTQNLNLAKYQKKNLRKNMKMIDLIKSFELSKEDHIKLLEFSKKLKIDFISSAFDISSLKFLIGTLKLKTLKIPSGEITNLPYLIEAAKSKKKIILSTGMSNLSEIRKTLKIIMKYGLPRSNITILHCNTEYPTPFEDVNLNVLKDLKKKFKVKIGYSDHTLGTEVAVAAVALGATIIEKHFTLDTSAKGPDHALSADSTTFKKMVNKIREMEQILGPKIMRLRSIEIDKDMVQYRREST